MERELLMEAAKLRQPYTDAEWFDREYRGAYPTRLARQLECRAASLRAKAGVEHGS
jgi:hypothetical protein